MLTAFSPRPFCHDGQNRNTPHEKNSRLCHRPRAGAYGVV